MATPAHSRTTTGSGGRRALFVGATVATVALVGGGAVIALSTSGRGAASPGTPSGASPAGNRHRVPARPLPRLEVTTISPSSSTKATTSTLISVTFSAAPSVTSPTPRLSPSVAGHWVRSGATMTFHPTAGLLPDTTFRVRVPGAVRAREGDRSVSLGRAVTRSFSVGDGSQRRLQQLLAELHYLPLTFVPRPTAATASTATGGITTTAVTDAIATEPTQAAHVTTAPVVGRFRWTSSAVPSSLQAQWSPGRANLVTRGAVMAFEGDRGLAVDGVAGPQVWGQLRTAVAARQTDPRPYSYLLVTKSLPERLEVWQGGTIVYTSPANTGVPGADTTDGTFAVTTHDVTTEMKGTNVDGTKYDDKNIPYTAYFNGGDAIHGYVRSSYGSPQSNGCVELPVANAGAVFDSGDDWYGTLVNVS